MHSLERQHLAGKLFFVGSLAQYRQFDGILVFQQTKVAVSRGYPAFITGFRATRTSDSVLHGGKDFRRCFRRSVAYHGIADTKTA